MLTSTQLDALLRAVKSCPDLKSIVWQGDDAQLVHSCFEDGFFERTQFLL